MCAGKEVNDEEEECLRKGFGDLRLERKLRVKLWRDLSISLMNWTFPCLMSLSSCKDAGRWSLQHLEVGKPQRVMALEALDSVHLKWHSSLPRALYWPLHVKGPYGDREAERYFVLRGKRNKILVKSTTDGPKSRRVLPTYYFLLIRVILGKSLNLSELLFFFFK